MGADPVECYGVPRLARLVLVALALGCAAYLAWGHYSIGLQYQGGASVTVDTIDPRVAEFGRAAGWTVGIHRDDLEFDRVDGTREEVEALVAQVAPGTDIER